MAHPFRLIWIGVAMMLVGGIILPFLMTIRVINVDAINQVLALILEFASYAIGVAGLFMGIIGVATYTRIKRPPNK